jgi:hypothetical protein
MQLVQLIKEIEQSFELKTPLTEVKGGRFFIPIDENAAILLSEEGGHFLLESAFGEIPADPRWTGREEFFRDLLLGNLLGQATRGAILSLDEKGEKLHLAMRIPDNTPFPRFMEKLEDFIDVIDFWREELSSKR